MMKRTKLVYEAIVDYLLEHDGQPPSIREIGQAVGLNSTSAVTHHTDKLIDDGKIIRLSHSKGDSRVFGIPGAKYTLPGHVVGSHPQWEVAIAYLDDPARMYFVKYQGEISYFSVKTAALSFFLTKMFLHYGPKYSLRDMVQFSKWFIECLDGYTYVNHQQALDAGVLPHGKVPEDQGT